MSLHELQPFDGLPIGDQMLQERPARSDAAASSSLSANTRPTPMSTQERVSTHLRQLGVVVALSTRNEKSSAASQPSARDGKRPQPALIHFRVSHAGKSPCLELRTDQGAPSEQVPGATVLDARLAQKLAKALEAASRSELEFGSLYADAVRLAVIARELGNREDAGAATMRGVDATPRRARNLSGLPKWRLKRLNEYVHKNLDRKVTLADMASAAGLSRMYFAAQFRAAMGVSPHEFLLRTRIERAQTIMRETSASLVQVALEVGFQTQTHFTTVFHRVVGTTPRQWRVSMSDRLA